MEVWDLYDQNRTPTGQTHIRGRDIPEGNYHLVVHVWIRNSRGEYLISQRSANRPSFPLMWETPGGSVLAGEDSLTGAIREVKEEVGIALDAQRGRVSFSEVRNIINGKSFRDILDVWLFPYDGPLALENATTDEVTQVRWASPCEIKQMLDSGSFVNTLSYFFEKVDSN